MKLVSAHYLLEEPKVLFYFSAESRVDFRELVKDLVSVFKIRIELRQIGVRDEARVTGGCGVCGRVLCCHGVTDKLVPVSIKMAKDQNLSLNSMKISGPCGRLLCCLAYEYGFYRDARRELPGRGRALPVRRRAVPSHRGERPLGLGEDGGRGRQAPGHARRALRLLGGPLAGKGAREGQGGIVARQAIDRLPGVGRTSAWSSPITG